MRREYLFFLFVALVLFLQAAQATEYILTETQLQKLEAICQNYKENNAKLQSQVNALQKETQSLKENSTKALQKLKSESETLTNQLETERTSTQNLNDSLTKYEASNAQLQNEAFKLQQEITQKEIKIGRYRTATIALTAAVIVSLLAAAACLRFRLK